MVILCPLIKHDSARGRFDENAKCFLLCEFPKKNQLQSESVVKEGAVTKRVSGIFVEATVDDSIKSDFDREYDQGRSNEKKRARLDSSISQSPTKSKRHKSMINPNQDTY